MNENAEKISTNEGDDDAEDSGDIEAMMARELAQIKDTRRGPIKSKDEEKNAKLFTSVKLDTQCGMLCSYQKPNFV